MNKTWKTSLLGDFLVIRNDKSKQIKSSEYELSGVLPVIDQSEEFICGHTNQINKKYTGTLPVVIFGDHTRHVKFIDFEFVAGADGTQILQAAKHLNPKYFYYLVTAASQAIGNYGYDRHFKHLKKIEVKYPVSRLVQQKIAEVLTSIDQTIAHTEVLIQKYQQIKAGLMHHLFTRGITSDGQLRPPREQAPELYKESAIGWIPREWTAKKLGELVQFQRGHDIVESNFEKGTYPVVSSSGVIGYHSKCTTKAPNVVIGRKGTIGKVHFLDVDFWAHDTSLYAINLYRNDPLFIYYLCNYLNLARFGTKSGSPSLNRNDIHPLEIACPSPDEQKMISFRLISVDKKIEVVNQDLEKLTKQRSGLMQDLLTGKVPVTISES